MEDGVKEDPAQYQETKFLGKAGWVKKAQGRLLASYKDRFIHVEKTEIVVYENEDLQNCLERLDLENYDKCHELKSPFKRKHRLILIRSPKSANKLHDLKFQAQTAEEKEAWIKALGDGINRAKNKIFDEVKIDQGSNLEHVTRSRPKGNRNRRPPTRIHMKEIADVSSDGILRLDLDLENALMPNGTHHVSVDGAVKWANESSRPTSDVSEAAEKQSERSTDEEIKSEEEATPQKKIIKPPMPPIKEAKPSSPPEDEPGKEDTSEKKVLKPPMPPSKEVKTSVSPEEEPTEDPKAEKIPEKSLDAKKKAAPPPTPPNKPSSNTPTSNLTEASQPRPNSGPPTPPGKEKKPSHPAGGPEQEVEATTDEDKEDEHSMTETTGTAVETDEAQQLISKEDDGPDDSGAGQVSEEESGGTNKESDNEPQAPTEPPRKSPTPPLVPKKKPEKPAQPKAGQLEDKPSISQPNDEEDSTATISDTSASSLQAEEALTKSGVPTVAVSLNDPVTDSLSLSPLLCHLPGEKKKKAEEKSVDSGQHSDDDSEGSGSEDTLAASTAALRGSNTGLDVLDASEGDVKISVNLRHPQVASKPQIVPKAFSYRHSQPTPPLKPSVKARSASSGDLLSDPSVCPQQGQQTRAEVGSNTTPSDHVMKLEAEVALEMKKTRELLSRVSKSEGGGEGEAMPEDLLTKAMDKLKKADHVLREVKKLAPAKNSSHRKSW
ncbi:pleckstrin homology domain-containing family O member 2 [Notolabrus celidotus]|uniref:pleckstrin homology domain-containing family O member 2 n=1 Tax=Notolabrus celidotus TaxID=1203425 RepID=UPI00148F5BC5|nr:pleckstrin homology domain-containing family O member 2 [Notolabrus celidotus]